MYRIQASILCRQIAMRGYWVRVTQRQANYTLHVATPPWNDTLSSTYPEQIRYWLATHPIEENQSE